LQKTFVVHESRVKGWAVGCGGLCPRLRASHTDGHNHQAEQNQSVEQNEPFASHNFLLNLNKKKIRWATVYTSVDATDAIIYCSVFLSIFCCRTKLAQDSDGSIEPIFLPVKHFKTS
jgi:hypothetical protein